MNIFCGLLEYVTRVLLDHAQWHTNSMDGKGREANVMSLKIKLYKRMPFLFPFML